MFRVDAVPLHASAALRRRILRPGQPPGAASWAGEDTAGSATFVVVPAEAAPGDGEAALSTVTVMPAPCPWRPGAAVPWRLRGMATDDGRRGQGLGRLALDAAVAHVRAEGATVLWCNARIGAVPFYERAGFAVEGPEFAIADIGPHRPMTLVFDGGRAGSVAG